MFQKICKKQGVRLFVCFGSIFLFDISPCWSGQKVSLKAQSQSEHQVKKQKFLFFCNSSSSEREQTPSFTFYMYFHSAFFSLCLKNGNSLVTSTEQGLVMYDF